MYVPASGTNDQLINMHVRTHLIPLSLPHQRCQQRTPENLVSNDLHPQTYISPQIMTFCLYPDAH
jgi:hypothetical protein